MKRMLTGVLAGLALAMLPVGASASEIHETLTGVETAVPQPCSGGSASPFAGTARGDLHGVWQASICHTALPDATILSGTFQLQTRSRSLSGNFTSGSVKFVRELDFDGVCRQYYTVIGQLSNGSFNATLTHYGAFYGGSCHVFSASVSGTAVLNA